ncbi:MAG: diaminopimelate epimerase [Thermoanaerobaculum sp.]|nr:diaminopimelate epimerase [Thermoanaerobaculum sp.]MDW7967903.1 diaminopimelate epimerase [Thermoanaerobaculum sp.]
MRFAKWHGAGNDFLLFLPEDGQDLERRLPALVPFLCHRRLGIGADGVLLLVPQGPAHVRLVYFNQDGSRAAFCANGARCAAAFLRRRLGLSQVLLDTDFGPVPAVVGEAEVTLQLPPPQPVTGWLELPVGTTLWRGFALTVGVPHLVLPVAWSDFWSHPLAEAPALRAHPLLGPEGANVHFAQTQQGQLGLRSYERGVEGETLSCGSGAVAAAWVAMAEGWLAPPVVVRTASRRVLTVAPQGKNFREGLQLSGPAEPVAEGEVAAELVSLAR